MVQFLNKSHPPRSEGSADCKACGSPGPGGRVLDSLLETNTKQQGNKQKMLHKQDLHLIYIGLCCI